MPRARASAGSIWTARVAWRSASWSRPAAQQRFCQSKLSDADCGAQFRGSLIMDPGLLRAIDFVEQAGQVELRGEIIRADREGTLIGIDRLGAVSLGEADFRQGSPNSRILRVESQRLVDGGAGRGDVLAGPEYPGQIQLTQRIAGIERGRDSPVLNRQGEIATIGQRGRESEMHIRPARQLVHAKPKLLDGLSWPSMLFQKVAVLIADVGTGRVHTDSLCERVGCPIDFSGSSQRDGQIRMAACMRRPFGDHILPHSHTRGIDLIARVCQRTQHDRHEEHGQLPSRGPKEGTQRRRTATATIATTATAMAIDGKYMRCS